MAPSSLSRVRSLSTRVRRAPHAWSSDHCIQIAERTHPHLAARRLCLDHDLFAGEWVAALARRGGRFLDRLQLHEAHEVEFSDALLAEVGGDNLAECVEHFLHFAGLELGAIGNLPDDIGARTPRGGGR